MTRDEILTRVPHGPAMCLLDGVTHCDGHRIEARGVDFRNAAHPLARNGRLGAVALLEYGAQAAGLHALVTAGGGAREARRGVVAAITGATGVAGELDATPGPAIVEAERVMASAQGLVYNVRVDASMVEAGGRITLMQAATGAGSFA